MSRTPRLRRVLQNTGNAIKQGLLQQSNLFESLNFRYFGPVDGHDVVALTKVLRDLKDIPGPKLLHVLTVKGKGYKPAEADQATWHAPGRFNPETGELLSNVSPDTPMRYQDVFGHTLLELALDNPNIVAVTPAMPTGCSMNIMMDQLPDRCFDVGIAEGHAVTFSAGLATQGLVPFCNIYSSFMQRAYDNVIHDVALQNLGVVFCLDRAGLVGEDGPTHHGVFDMAYFRSVPNVIISAPMNEIELRNLMYTASVSGAPFVIRYPRGNSIGIEFNKEFELLPIGKGKLLREGNDVAVLTIGHVGNFAKDAIERAEREGISVEHIDLRYAKPLDTELLHRVGKKFKRVITVEDGVIEGGVGSAILEFFAHEGYTASVTLLGVNDAFIEHGTPSELYRLCKYDAEGIYQAITEQ